MARIIVSKIKVYAHHGCLPEETIIGSDYEVNVVVDCDITNASLNDDLSSTIDYVCINTIVKQEMKKPSKLLENAVLRILRKVVDKYPKINSVEVSVAKQNPPINGDVKKVVVVDKFTKGLEF